MTGIAEIDLLGLIFANFAKKATGKNSSEPLLIAVSKTKSNDLIKEAYECGQRDFGENYVQELVQKAAYFKQHGGYDDIRWHFIGNLQRNKVNNLLGASNLEVVQTVDSPKLADAINKSWKKKMLNTKLKVYVQVNSSGEENKSGCLPSECLPFVQHVRDTCDMLQLQGLMTIGSFNHDYSQGPNPDFECLCSCREEVCKTLELNTEELHLSMGMSADYQQAILAGSTTVRVGSTIFGARDNNKPPVNKTSATDETNKLTEDLQNMNAS